MSSHGHEHGVPLGVGAGAGAHRGRLAVVLAITVTILVVEVVGAAVSGSLALLADAGHVLTDVAGLALALVAAALAQRRPATRRTWGYRRAEVLAAAAQAAVLLAVGGFVLVEGVRRLLDPPEVAAGAMLVFGVVGLLGQRGGDRGAGPARAARNLNMRAAFLEVVNDALGSVAVLVAAALIALIGWAARRRGRVAGDRRADPAAHLAAAARDGRRAARVDPPGRRPRRRPRAPARRAARARRCTTCTPRTVATDLPVLTAHVVVDDSCFHDGHLPAAARPAAAVPGRALRRRALDAPVRGPPARRARARRARLTQLA